MWARCVRNLSANKCRSPLETWAWRSAKMFNRSLDELCSQESCSSVPFRLALRSEARKVVSPQSVCCMVQNVDQHSHDVVWVIWTIWIWSLSSPQEAALPLLLIWPQGFPPNDLWKWSPEISHFIQKRICEWSSRTLSQKQQKGSWKPVGGFMCHPCPGSPRRESVWNRALQARAHPKDHAREDNMRLTLGTIFRILGPPRFCLSVCLFRILVSMHHHWIQH